MLLEWKKAGVTVFAGYILGFPGETPGDDPAGYRSHPARTADRFAGVPLSDAAAGVGRSPAAFQEGTYLDPDLNKYDLEHVVTTIPT